MNQRNHAEHIQDLLYFPECGMASYVMIRREPGSKELDQRVIMGPVRFAEIDYGSWATWVHGDESMCEVCGLVFLTAQAKASHRRYVHKLGPDLLPDTKVAEPYGRHKNPNVHPELRDAKPAPKPEEPAVAARKRNPW